MSPSDRGPALESAGTLAKRPRAFAKKAKFSAKGPLKNGFHRQVVLYTPDHNMLRGGGKICVQFVNKQHLFVCLHKFFGHILWILPSFSRRKRFSMGNFVQVPRSVRRPEALKTASPGQAGTCCKILFVRDLPATRFRPHAGSGSGGAYGCSWRAGRRPRPAGAETPGSACCPSGRCPASAGGFR